MIALVLALVHAVPLPHRARRPRRSGLCPTCHGIGRTSHVSPSSTLDETGVRIDTSTLIVLPCTDCPGTGVPACSVSA